MNYLALDTDPLPSLESPFLQGRAFVFASSFVLILSEKGISGQYLEATVQALESDAVEAVVKICAVKCIRKSVSAFELDGLQGRY